MLYTVSLSKRAAKFLEGLRDRTLYERLRAAMDSLATNPVPPGSKSLSGRRDSGCAWGTIASSTPWTAASCSFASWRSVTGAIFIGDNVKKPCNLRNHSSP